MIYNFMSGYIFGIISMGIITGAIATYLVNNTKVI